MTVAPDSKQPIDLSQASERPRTLNIPIVPEGSGPNPLKELEPKTEQDTEVSTPFDANETREVADRQLTITNLHAG